MVRLRRRLLVLWFCLGAAASAAAQETLPTTRPQAEALLAVAEAAFAAAENADDGVRSRIFVRSAYAEAEEAYLALTKVAALESSLAGKAWIGAGWSAARAGRLEEALSHFDRAEREDPASAVEATFAAARTLLEAGKQAEALERVAPYLEDRSSPHCGDAYLLTLAVLLEGSGRAAARAAFLADYDGVPFTAQMEAWRLFAGRFRDLPGDSYYLDLLSEAQRANPQDAATLFWQGDRLLARGKFPEALARFRRFRSLRPFEPEGLIWTAVAEIRNGLLDAAQDTLTSALNAADDPSLAPAAWSAAREMSGALYQAKKFAAAAANQEAIAAMSGDAQDLLDAASLWKDAGEFDRAAAVSDRLLAREDLQGARRAKAANDRGLLEYGRGRVDEAEAWFRKAIAAWDDERDARENLGILLLAAGRPAEGRPLLEWCVARENGRVRSRYHLFRADHPELDGPPSR